MPELCDLLPAVVSEPPPLSPIAAVHYARLFGLGELRDEFVQRASQGRTSDAESREWARLEHAHRVVLMLLAGLDGELSELANRAWRELPEPERVAIKQEARTARAGFSRLFAMTGRW